MIPQIVGKKGFYFCSWHKREKRKGQGGILRKNKLKMHKRIRAVNLISFSKNLVREFIPKPGEKYSTLKSGSDLVFISIGLYLLKNYCSHIIKYVHGLCFFPGDGGVIYDSAKWPLLFNIINSP